VSANVTAISTKKMTPASGAKRSKREPDIENLLRKAKDAASLPLLALVGADSERTR
jgi:hypothetical protein